MREIVIFTSRVKPVLAAMPEVCIRLAASYGQTVQLLQSGSPDALIVDNPGLTSAAIRTLAGLSDAVCVVLVRSSVYDGIMYQLQDTGIMVLEQSLAPGTLAQVLEGLFEGRKQLLEMRKQLEKQRRKNEEQQIIWRCKALLMEKQGWTEQQAHYFLEKTAMDKCTSKVRVAKALLAKY
jgi:response regulator NasT